jgi:hypothetical protein
MALFSQKHPATTLFVQRKFHSTLENCRPLFYNQVRCGERIWRRRNAKKLSMRPSQIRRRIGVGTKVLQLSRKGAYNQEVRSPARANPFRAASHHRREAAGWGRGALFVPGAGRLLGDDDDPPSNVSETSIAPFTSPKGPPPAPLL